MIRYLTIFLLTVVTMRVSLLSMAWAVELTPQQRGQVDELVGQRLASMRESTVRECNLEANIRELSLRKKEWQAWQPAMQVGFCAKKFRDQHLGVPPGINERVVDDIIWQYDNADGDTVQDRKYPREECARALGFIGHPKGVPTILQSLQQEGGHFSWQALEGIADVRFIPAIEKHLDFTNQQDAFPAIRCLSRLGEAAIPTLQRFLQGKDMALQRRAYQALIEVETPASLRLLQEAHQAGVAQVVGVDLEAGMRKIQCRAIDKTYTPPMLAPEDESRIWHLSFLALEDHLPSLPPAYTLKDNDELTRSRARKALLSVGALSCGVLREQMSSQTHYDDFVKGADYYVAKRAAEILQAIGTPAIPSLIDALCVNSYSHTRRLATQALQSITGEKIGPEYEAWSQWYKKQK